MEYYINPAWLYWIDVAGCAKTVFIIAALLLFIASTISLIVRMCNAEYGADDPDYKMAKQCFKICFPLLIVSCLAAVMIPSKDVLIEMLIAKLATKDNVSMTVETLKSVVDYIVDAINKVK